MSNNPDNDKFSAGKGYPTDLTQKITIIKGTGQSDSKVPHLVSGSKISSTAGQLITHASLMRPTGQIISQGMSSQPQLLSTSQATLVSTSGITATPLLQGAQIISQGQQGGGPIVGQATLRTLPTAVRLMPSISIPAPALQHQHQHLATAVSNPSPRPQNTIAVQSGTTVKQLTTNYHVPRGPAAVASLAVPRGSAAPRGPTPSPTPSWSSGAQQCYVPRPARPHTLQMSAQRPQLRQVTPQVSTAVVARAVRPANTPSPQRTPPPQVLQSVNPLRTPAPKVVPLVQRNYQPKVVGITALGVRPTISPRGVGSTYYYEVSSGVAPAAPTVSHQHQVQQVQGMQQGMQVQQQQGMLSISQTLPSVQGQSLNNVVMAASHVNTFAGVLDRSQNDLVRAPSSPGGPPRPSILRKRDNEGSPLKCNIPPPPPATSPPPSPGGSTTVSAASSPGPDDDMDNMMPMQSLSQAVTQPRDLHSLTQAASQSRDLHNIMNQSRDQIMNQSRDQNMNQSRDQIMNQSRDQIMNQSRDHSMNQLRDSHLMGQSRDSMTQIVSQSRDFNRSQPMVSQPSRDMQALTQAVSQVVQPQVQMIQQQVSHGSAQAEQPAYNNCSPRKKPRKQLLTSERPRGGECEFPSEGGPAPAAPSPPSPPAEPPAPPHHPQPPPPEREKPRRCALLGAGWKCGWRATALHFTRPTDVRRREERRPSVVELAAQRHVLQKANGWKIHHLTAQMDDLAELEAGVLEQAAEILRVVENKPQNDHHIIRELLKGNIQRTKIVAEGVSEARSNVLRVFQHKSHVSDILARQADKRCFKKHRNQC